jgi:nucleotide-binding universal stress UspA family protein
MLTFKHILFPVDLSAQCREAAPFVRAAATRFTADITMLHVMEIPPYWFGAMGAESFAAMVDLPKLTEQRKQQVDDFLKEELANVPVERILEQGDPASLIDDVAEKRKIDLVMMPTHGHGPFRRLLLGSVTAKVLHDLRCPIWTGAHAERQATRPNDIRSMMCALDLTQESVPVLDWTARLADVYGAKLRIVHAVPGSEAPPDQFFDTDLDAFLMQTAREEIGKLQSSAGTAFQVCIARGDVAHVVRDAAIHHDADLIVIGRGLIKKTLGRFRTHAYSIIREAPCPVLSV